MFEISEKEEWLSAQPGDLSRVLKEIKKPIDKKEMRLVGSRLQQLLYRAVDTNAQEVVEYLMAALPVDFLPFPREMLTHRAIFERAFRAQSFDVLAVLIRHGSEETVINYNLYMTHLFLSSGFDQVRLEEMPAMAEASDDGSVVCFLLRQLVHGRKLPLCVFSAIEEKQDLALWDLLSGVDGAHARKRPL